MFESEGKECSGLNYCRGCRYKKCLDVGMNVSGINYTSCQYFFFKL